MYRICVRIPVAIILLGFAAKDWQRILVTKPCLLANFVSTENCLCKSPGTAAVGVKNQPRFRQRIPLGPDRPTGVLYYVRSIVAPFSSRNMTELCVPVRHTSEVAVSVQSQVKRLLTKDTCIKNC